MVKPAVYASIFLALGVFVLGTQLAYAKKPSGALSIRSLGITPATVLRRVKNAKKGQIRRAVPLAAE